MDKLQDNTRAYIRGCGIVCAIGTTQQQLAAACRDKTVKPDLVSPIDPSEAAIPYYRIPMDIHPAQTNRLYQFIDRAVTNAIQDAGLSASEKKNTAVLCGSTACDISDLEEHYQNDLQQSADAIALYRSGFGILAEYVDNKFELSGQEYSFNTACSSSANAFIAAAEMIHAGRCDHAVVLGVEVFNQLSFQGFNSMMLLSQDQCRPFDAKRNGTLLGESVAVVVLSKETATQSGFYNQYPFYFLGGANRCDIKSVTSSNADIVADVMQAALNNASLPTEQIDVIKAHGTSTENNDAAEGMAMKKLFADRVPMFTSLKPYLGHTLGACGLAEMIVLLASIKQGFIPCTPTFANPDPELGISPLREQAEFENGTIMLNYFGFGGNNSSLILCNH